MDRRTIYFLKSISSRCWFAFITLKSENSLKKVCSSIITFSVTFPN